MRTLLKGMEVILVTFMVTISPMFNRNNYIISGKLQDESGEGVGGGGGNGQIQLEAR
jgi:hypothetical protein